MAKASRGLSIIKIFPAYFSSHMIFQLVGVSSEWTTDGLELPVGLGFWYYSAGSSTYELAWPTAQQ